MPISDIYLAYKNYIHHDYGANVDLKRQLIKKHNVYEGVDRITQKYVTEDIEKSDILIKKGYWALSIKNSSVTAADQIKDFYIQYTGIGSNICFDTSRCFLHHSNVHVIVKREEDIMRVAKQLELQKIKVNIPNEEIFDKVHSISPHIKKQKTADLRSLNKEGLLIKGVVNFSYDDDIGEEYPYFGILPQGGGNPIINVFRELLEVISIDGKYYFVSYWQEPECGKRGLEVYTLERQSLKIVFADGSDST